MQKNKKAVSQIITTILIILIVLVAIALVWSVIKNLVKEKTGEIDIELMMTGLSISENSVFINEQVGNLSLSVSRGADDANFSAIKIIVYGNERSLWYEIKDYPMPLETKTYVLNISGLTNINKISVYPVSQKGNYGTEEKKDTIALRKDQTPEDGWQGPLINSGGSGGGGTTPGPTIYNYYRDADGDSFGNLTNTTQAESAPSSAWVSNSNDCNDYNAAIKPGANEICGDSVDNDCSGADLACSTCSQEAIPSTGCNCGGANYYNGYCCSGVWQSSACTAPLTGHLGKGCTTAYYIDVDCDGYGVGPGVLGPDADDNNVSVNTNNTIGNLQTFLSNIKGYNPTRIFYIATNGNDATGAVNDINKPYATWNAIRYSVRPGDAVIWRGGTYVNKYTMSVSELDGTESNPIIIMAYPGEKVILDAWDISISIISSSYLIFDGFVLDDIGGTGGGEGGVHGNTYHNITFRNLESKNHQRGFLATHIHDILIENNVFYNSVTHGIYLAARADPSSNVIIRDNIIFNNGRHGFQHNGRITNLTLEDNIIHSNNLGGFSFLNGVSYSTVRNNLIFNSNTQGIIFATEDADKGTEQNPYILPYNQTNNLVVNNVIWMGRYSWNNGYNPTWYNLILFNDYTVGRWDGSSWNISMDNNIFRNNIFVTYSTPIFKFVQKKWANTTTIENNIFYRMDNIDQVMDYGGDIYDSTAFETFINSVDGSASENVFADPLFEDVSINYYNQVDKFNFSYSAGSPAIDFGISTGAPAYDLRGISRPRSGGYDAGCYEY